MRFCLKLSKVAGSSRKSNFVPTRMIGTDGAWWSISGNHYRHHSVCISISRPRGAAYLGANVVKGRRADDREADEEHIRLRIRERSQSIVILLSSGIPQTQANWFAIHHNTGRVIIEPAIINATAMRPGVLQHLHRGDIFAGERIGRIGYEETCLRMELAVGARFGVQSLYLSNSTITGNDAL